MILDRTLVLVNALCFAIMVAFLSSDAEGYWAILGFVWTFLFMCSFILMINSMLKQHAKMMKQHAVR